jgi:hypothetical protein
LVFFVCRSSICSCCLKGSNAILEWNREKRRRSSDASTCLSQVVRTLRISDEESYSSINCNPSSVVWYELSCSFISPWAFRNWIYLLDCSQLKETELSRCVFLMPFFAAFRIATEIAKELLLLDGKARSMPFSPPQYRSIF